MHTRFFWEFGSVTAVVSYVHHFHFMMKLKSKKQQVSILFERNMRVTHAKGASLQQQQQRQPEAIVCCAVLHCACYAWGNKGSTSLVLGIKFKGDAFFVHMQPLCTRPFNCYARSWVSILFHIPNYKTYFQWVYDSILIFKLNILESFFG